MLDKIESIKKKHEGCLLRVSGVLGVGTSKDSIIVYVEKGKLYDPNIPIEIEGIPVKIERSE